MSLFWDKQFKRNQQSFPVYVVKGGFCPAALSASSTFIILSAVGGSVHAEIVKDKQGEAAKAGYVFVPVLVAGGKVIEDKGKVRHAHGNLTYWNIRYRWASP